MSSNLFGSLRNPASPLKTGVRLSSEEIPVVEIALIVALCFVCYLALCAIVILRAGSTRGLRHVTQAVLALRGIITLRT